MPDTSAMPSTTGTGYRRVFETRWADNDIYGHLNNTIYYQAMDTTINAWMMEVAGFDPLTSDVLGFCVSSSCQFRAAASFPETIAVDLSHVRIGTSSLTWSPRILRDSDDLLLAEGEFVAVFVDAENRRPTPIPPHIRETLEASFAVTT